jgi:hypothetical protein
VDHLDAFAAEDLVKGGAELAVPVVDQEARPLEDAGEAEVARLLGDPGAGRVGRAAGEVDATASELDEEENVVAVRGDRFDGEEVTRQRACRLLAQELSPAWPPRRGAGVSPAVSSSRRTVLGETRTPSLSSSPAIRG